MEPVTPPRQLKIGTIIDRSLGVVEFGIRPVAIYVVALTVISGALTYFLSNPTAPMLQLGIALVQFVVGISAAYLLLEAILGKAGLRSRTDDDVFLAYFLLSIVSILGTIAGLIVFILPGLVIMARWSIAAPMLVARGGGAMKTLGESWEQTKGNEFAILVAILALIIVPIAIMIASGALFEQRSLAAVAVSQLASSAMSALLLAMGVALYGLIASPPAAASPPG